MILRWSTDDHMIIEKHKQIIQRISSDDLSTFYKQSGLIPFKIPIIWFSIEDGQLIIVWYDNWRTNLMLFCWFHYAHLIIIWLLSHEYPLIIWLSLKDHQMIISRSTHDHLKRIICYSMIIVCLISLDHLFVLWLSFVEYL